MAVGWCRSVGSRPCQCGNRELWKSLYTSAYILNSVYVCPIDVMFGLGQYALVLEYDMKIVKKDINDC